MSNYKCEACKDTGWLEAIGPCADGSYITSRPCNMNCDARYDWVRESHLASRKARLANRPESA